jgi:hypothetical protein
MGFGQRHLLTGDIDLVEILADGVNLLTALDAQQLEDAPGDFDTAQNRPTVEINLGDHGRGNDDLSAIGTAPLQMGIDGPAVGSGRDAKLEALPAVLDVSEVEGFHQLQLFRIDHVQITATGRDDHLLFVGEDGVGARPTLNGDIRHNRIGFPIDYFKDTVTQSKQSILGLHHPDGDEQTEQQGCQKKESRVFHRYCSH